MESGSCYLPRLVSKLSKLKKILSISYDQFVLVSIQKCIKYFEHTCILEITKDRKLEETDRQTYTERPRSNVLLFCLFTQTIKNHCLMYPRLQLIHICIHIVELLLA